MSNVTTLLGGVGVLARGFKLVAGRPRLFLLGALPPLITSTAFVVVVIVVVDQLQAILAWLTPFVDDWASGIATLVRIVIGVALLAALILIMVVSFTTLTLAIGSPLYDHLSKSCEEEFGEVPEHEEPVAAGIFRGLRQSVALIAVSAAGAIALFGLGFIPVVGQTVVPVISAIFGGWLLAIELVGSALDRRGLLRLADRRTVLRRNRARVLGFGIPTFLLLAIPFAGAVVFPAAMAGGTLLARELLSAPPGPKEASHP